MRRLRFGLRHCLLGVVASTLVGAGCAETSPPWPATEAGARVAAMPTPTRAPLLGGGTGKRGWFPARGGYRHKWVDPRSLTHAVRVIRRRVPVPVSLPAPLPEDVTLPTRKALYLSLDEGLWGAHLYLDVPDEESILIQWGSANFDGCGGDSATPVRVGGMKGLIYMSRAFDGSPSGQIVWPANRTVLEGTYGLSGPFDRRELVDLAESMSPSRFTTTEGISGC